MPLKSCDPLRTRTSGDLFFIRSALSQLNSMLCYITKAPIPQENMSLSLNLKLKKNTLKRVYLLVIKANEMALFLKFIFGKELCMFRTDLLSIIRSFNTVYTSIGICHTSYVDCLLATSGS